MTRAGCKSTVHFSTLFSTTKTFYPKKGNPTLFRSSDQASFNLSCYNAYWGGYAFLLFQVF